MDKESRFMQNAYVEGEVRKAELGDVGGRKNEQLRIDTYVDGNFINVKMNNPSKADKNYAEDLYDKLSKGDKITVNGTLDEYFYNDEFRRNVQPYISAKKGYGNNVSVYPAEKEIEEKATARIGGDVIDLEEGYSEDGEERWIKFKILYFSDWNPQGDELDRVDILRNTIQNYIDYNKNNDKDVEFGKLDKLLEMLEDTLPTDLETIVDVYDKFNSKFNPMMFNIAEYNIVAKDEFAEEMEDVVLYDNITTGVRIKNQTIIDDFGFQSGTTNELEVGKFLGVNASLGAETEELGNDWE